MILKDKSEYFEEPKVVERLCRALFERSAIFLPS